MVRTLAIWHLNKFLSAQCSTVHCKYIVVQQISRIYSSCITEILSPLNSNSPFLSSPSLWQPPFDSVSMSLTSLDTSYEWNHAVFVFLWLACFTWHYVPPDLSISFHMTGLPFLRLTICCMYIPLYPLIHWWTFGYISLSWLLWIVLHRTWDFGYKILISFP